MDDYLSWQAGSLSVGIYRDGGRREWRVYAIGYARSPGDRFLPHMKGTEHLITDDFGNLVPIPFWLCQPERTHE